MLPLNKNNNDINLPFSAHVAYMKKIGGTDSACQVIF